MIKGNCRVVWVIYVLLLNACMTPFQQVERDRPPLKRILEQDIKELTPQADPITMTGNQSPYWVNGVRYKVLESASKYREVGVASWYGQKFNAKLTSNGEIFDVYGISCLLYTSDAADE